MPAKVKKGVLAGFDLSKEIAAHAKETTTAGLIKLPSGITNGIAKVQECYFALGENGEMKGKPYLRAMAVVIEPEYIGTRRIAGLQTSIVIPCCETSKASKDENVDRCFKMLRSLAGETSTASVKTGSDLEALAAAIMKVGPYTAFTTTMSPKTFNPDGTVKYDERVWENWQGNKGLEKYVPPTPVNGTALSVTNDRSATVATLSQDEHTEQPPPSDPSMEYREDSDLDSLGDRADAGDPEAIEQLRDYAKEKGISEATVNDAKDWVSVVAMLKGGSSDNSDQPDTVDWTPSVGDEVGYAPPGKKPGTKLKVMVCEVTSVLESGQTVNLISKVDKKIKFKAIPWSELVTD